MDQLLKKLDLSRIPAHVAVIMDGNRRWAKAKGLPVPIGHARGVESVHAVVKTVAVAQGDVGAEGRSPLG